MKKPAVAERASRATVAGPSDNPATRRKRVRQLIRYRTQREIAELLGVSQATVWNDLHDAPSYVPRLSRWTFQPEPGRITISEAATRFGVGRNTLARAIDSGVIRGRSHELSDCCIRTVDPDELAADIENLPRCRSDGCDTRAFASSGYCGPHASGAKNRGHSLDTETRGKISASKRGRPQPWTRENVAAIHADPKRRADWGIAMATGRELAPTVVRKWKNRANGLRGHRPRAADADPLFEEKREKVLEARARNSGISERALERLSGLSRRQVRAVLAEPD